MKSKIKVGDEVLINVGSYKSSKRYKVLQVFPKKNTLIIEGVNFIKKHQKKDQENPNGNILEREAPIHISNVIKADLHK